MQRRKLRSIRSTGALLSRGDVQEGNLCSLPCTTSKAVVCWLPYAASLPRAVKKDITKYQTQITQCQVPSCFFLQDTTLSVILQLNSTANFYGVWPLKPFMKRKGTTEI